MKNNTKEEWNKECNNNNEGPHARIFSANSYILFQRNIKQGN